MGHVPHLWVTARADGWAVEVHSAIADNSRLEFTWFVPPEFGVFPRPFNRAILRLMTAPHPRRKAVAAALSAAFLVVLSACGSSSPQSTLTSAHCDAGTACTTSRVVSGDTSLIVASDASQGSQTVTAELVTDQKLHCPTGVPGGAIAIFSSTAADAAKTVTVTVSGNDGASISAAHRAHPHYLACYGSPQPFDGYTDGRSRRAVFIASDGLYEAALLPCASVEIRPCYQISEGDATVTLTVKAAAGDPKMGP